MDTVYKANMGHPDWLGVNYFKANRWQKRDGQWYSSFDEGQTWGKSLFTWDQEVAQGIIMPYQEWHTDDDLAMALELAQLLDAELVFVNYNPDTETEYETGMNIMERETVAHWLRAEVIRELRERGGAQ